jgi:hypothetical protein
MFPLVFAIAYEQPVAVPVFVMSAVVKSVMASLNVTV